MERIVANNTVSSSDCTVNRLDPFHCTVAPWVKPLPYTVRVKPGAPAAAVGGESEVMVGAGFWQITHETKVKKRIHVMLAWRMNLFDQYLIVELITGIQYNI